VLVPSEPLKLRPCHEVENQSERGTSHRQGGMTHGLPDGHVTGLRRAELKQCNGRPPHRPSEKTPHINPQGLDNQLRRADTVPLRRIWPMNCAGRCLLDVEPQERVFAQRSRRCQDQGRSGTGRNRSCRCCRARPGFPFLRVTFGTMLAKAGTPPPRGDDSCATSTST